MPVIKSVKKALRSSQKKAEYNKPLKARALSAVKKMKIAPSKENLDKAFSALDKAKKRNIFHKGKVARLKSRLAKLLVKDTITKKAVKTVKKTEKKKIKTATKKKTSKKSKSK